MSFNVDGASKIDFERAIGVSASEILLKLFLKIRHLIILHFQKIKTNTIELDTI
jgi:hypothetical protein